MLRIRLSRVGKKGRPSYRIVVADVDAPRDGAYLEWIGNYDPMANPPAITLKEDRAQHWLSLGASPSDAVMRILDKNGLIERTPKQRTRTRGDAATATAPTTPAPAASAAAVAEVEPPADESPAEEPAANEAPEEPSEA
jgi:small subunit ribosomal protein S16